MLKVVGASWEQTRLTYIILGAVIILSVFAVFFYEMPLKNEDGMYAATVSWSHKVGFKVDFYGQGNDPDDIPKRVARAYYKPETHTTGWANIEIETNGEYPDWVQAYGAGLLEGSLCWQLIYWHWRNTVEATCEMEEELCNEARDYLKKVEADARTRAKKAEKTEPFWHHVKLFYSQLDGLEAGWHLGVDQSRKKKELSIDHEDFLWMNSVNEIRDLKLKYDRSDSQITKQYTSLSFLKYLPNTTHQFLLAHETGKSYSEMLRMHKKYTFNFHETADENSKFAPVQTVTFTSYPGAIHSQDDYYRFSIDNGKNVTISGTNLRMSKTLVIESMEQHKVPIGPRAMAACRLARSAREWAGTVNREGGSNIGGKQWLVLETSNSSGLSLWLVEQVPKVAKAAEVMELFKEKGVWISAGIPFFKETQVVLGRNKTLDVRLREIVSKLLEWHENATSPDSLYDLMHKPELITLGRADIIQYDISTLEPENSTSQPENNNLQPRHGGIIDLKIADISGNKLVLSGPPYSEDVAPFQWSRSMLQNLPHHGQPDLWKYEPVKPDWVW